MSKEVKKLVEEWRSVGIEKCSYDVSTWGRVRNHKKYILKPSMLNGYPQVCLYVDRQPMQIAIHRLVAQIFIQNPENKSSVNHIDGNRTNNHIDNLEWNTQRENSLHASHELGKKKKSRSIIQSMKNGTFIKRFKGAFEAGQELNICFKAIRSCCNGKLKTAGGFKWNWETSKKLEDVNIDNLSEIPDFPNYLISRTGKIYSKTTKQFNIPLLDHNGYLRIGLHREGKSYCKGVHRLVAETFIPNPENLPIVNHKNHNKQDNNVVNLEWTTATGNAHSAIEFGAIKTLPVQKWSKNGETLITIYRSIREAVRQNVGTDVSGIVKCCKNKRKTHKGFVWKYVPKAVIEWID